MHLPHTAHPNAHRCLEGGRQSALQAELCSGVSAQVGPGRLALTLCVLHVDCCLIFPHVGRSAPGGPGPCSELQALQCVPLRLQLAAHPERAVATLLRQNQGCAFWTRGHFSAQLPGARLVVVGNGKPLLLLVNPGHAAGSPLCPPWMRVSCPSQAPTSWCRCAPRGARDVP